MIFSPALPVHALGALSVIVVVRDVDPRQVVGDDVTDVLKSAPGGPRAPMPIGSILSGFQENHRMRVI